jgi:hypothetical protein
VRGVIVRAIAAGATLPVAAQIAKVGASTISDRKAKDEKFREECDMARANVAAIVGMTIISCAMRAGTDRMKPGDAALLIFAAKNLDPQKWRDRKELEVMVDDVPGALRTAAERARETKQRMLDSLRNGAVTAEIVPFVASGNGNGNGGNGHG